MVKRWVTSGRERERVMVYEGKGTWDLDRSENIPCKVSMKFVLKVLSKTYLFISQYQA